MSGVDTIRGINYQHGQALTRIIEMVTEPSWEFIRVEAANDAIDLEIFGIGGVLLQGEQYKTRSTQQWSRGELLRALRKWNVLPEAQYAVFTFITDGALGPSAEELLGQIEVAPEPPDDLAEFSAVWRNTRFFRDDVSAESLVSSAAEKLLHLLPQRGIARDMVAAARALALELHQMVSQRSALTDPNMRIISRSEICQLLKVVPDSPTLSWGKSIIRHYLDQVEVREDLLPIAVASDSGIKVPLQHLIDEESAQILYGAAGSGKSKVGVLLRGLAAQNDKVVVLISAEGYVPGRLGQLIALELERVLGRPVPTAIGYDVWADESSIVVIDGASELDTEDGLELSRELRDLLLNHPRPRLLLIGRDLHRLRAVLPRVVDASVYSTSSWHRDEQTKLISSYMGSEVDSGAVEGRRRELSSQLGTAIENPYVLSEALKIYSPGEEVAPGRVALYRRLIEARAEEHGILDLELIELGLGRVYGVLMNEGRRYSDLYEWRSLCREAEGLVGLSEQTLDAAARAMGLVRAIGARTRLVPLHDSIADYLSAVAAAAGVGVFPVRYESADNGRISFLVELQALTEESFLRIVQDAPLELVAASRFDSRPVDEAWLSILTSALHAIRPHDPKGGLLGWRNPGHSQAWLVETAEPGDHWVSDASEREQALKRRPIYQVSSVVSAFAALWRRYLDERLSPPGELAPKQPRSASEARLRLLAHLNSTREIQESLINSVFTPSVRAALRATLADLDLEIHVGEQNEADGLDGGDWSVFYRRAGALSVELAHEDASHLGWSQSTVRHWLSQTPTRDALQNLRKALNERAIFAWL